MAEPPVRAMDDNGLGAEDVDVPRRRAVVAALALVVALLGALPAPSSALLGSAGGSGTPAAALDPVLQATLATAAPGSPVEAALVFRGVPTAGDLALVRAVGVATVPLSRLPMAIVRGTPAQLRALSLLAPVASLWGNHGLELVLHESVPQIQADAVWAAPYGFTGRGVRVAVLDSGIDGTHPDLAYPSKTVQNVKILGYQKYASPTYAIEDLSNTDTTTGHGTHVAGIIAGAGAASAGYYTGVAPGAELVGVGSADGTDMLTALAGYDWILANRERYGIKVINNSWADGKIAYSPDDPLNVASKAAADAGITVVFAAGNDGQSSGNVFNRYAWPDWVVSVGGTTKLGTIGDYSSAGDDVHHPTVMAPGSFIASTRASTGAVTNANSSPFDLTDPMAPRIIAPEHTLHYTAAIGTSMSAPHVAGVVALLLEAAPWLKPAQVKAILAATATPIAGCPVAWCGAGQVNALAAVQAALASANSAPLASLVSSVLSGAAPLSVVLDASGSVDVDGTVVSYRWDVDGDGDEDAVTGGPTLPWTYGPGVWSPAVRAVDDDGLASAPVSVEVRSSNPPVAAARAPGKAKSGTVVTFDASSSSDPDGSIVSWTFTFGDGTSVVSSSPVVRHAYAADRALVFGWTVTVTDDAGVSDATGGSIKITP
jgi:serine protease AprX